MEANGLPEGQMCSPMLDIGIAILQLEHLIVGRKLEARIVDAMFASHLLPTKTRFEECSLVYINTQLFVCVLRV